MSFARKNQYYETDFILGKMVFLAHPGTFKQMKKLQWWTPKSEKVRLNDYLTKKIFTTLFY